MDMHRGIYVIAKEAWPFLMRSDLEPILSRSKEFTSREPVGRHCESLYGMIEQAMELSEEESEGCKAATGYLQVGFDATELGVGDGELDLDHGKHQMIYSWTMLVPKEVTVLMQRKRPEALVLLAYYAVLLHRGRELWQVGDAGVYLFGRVAEYLGEEWVEWMEWPRQEIATQGSDEQRMIVILAEYSLLSGRLASIYKTSVRQCFNGINALITTPKMQSLNHPDDANANAKPQVAIP